VKLKLYPKSAHYALGLAAALCVLVGQIILSSWVQTRTPFVLFAPAIVGVSMVLGTGPSLLIVLVGLLYASGWVLSTRAPLAYHIVEPMAMLVYTAIGCFLALVGGQLRAAARRTATTEKKLYESRIQALKAEQENNRRFDVALESSGVAFCMLQSVQDPDSGVMDFNWHYVNTAMAALMVRHAHDIPGHALRALHPLGWDPQILTRHFATVCASRTTASMELHAVAGRSDHWFRVIASALGESVVAWFYDITHEKQQEFALKQADRRKNEFLATLAHELRNPLAPVRHALETWTNPRTGDAQRQWCVQVIDRQVKHMASLLDDLLDVSRITRGTLVVRKSTVDLQEILDVAFEAVVPLIEQKGHTFHTEVPKERMQIEVDPMRLAQVISNLLTNAAKFTPEGGTISFAARTTGEHITLSVSDNGIGFDPIKSPNLFLMFARGDHAVPALDGLGIGLALSKQLIELHGGTILAFSEGPGKGSRFAVTLPLHSNAQTDITVNARALASYHPGTRTRPVQTAPVDDDLLHHKVLIADDNRDAAEALAALMELDGHAVRIAYDGLEAVEAFTEEAPSVVLLDLGMPRMTGLEAARAIRTLPGGEGVLLVAVTGWGQAEDRARTAEAGFDYHLTKPINTVALRNIILAVSAA
jgi:signal transduction histidine kinase